MDLHEAERILAASAHHRILRRIPPIAEWGLKGAMEQERRAIFVDVETTGLNHDSDEVIELAILPFDYDPHTGAILRIVEADAFSGLRQPSIPIPPESAAIHGISDADVAGKSIDSAKVEALASAAHLIIAHNAGFDRPMVEKLWPIFEQKNWACSLNDVQWRDEGLGSGKLDYLLMCQGWFFDSHRALSDAQAGVFLLSRTLPLSKRPTLQALLECARRPLKAVRAEGTPFEAKAALKQRGYRWDAGDGARPKCWWILTDNSEAEVAWLNAEIYAKPCKIPVIDMPATKRYSARIWD